MSFGCGYSGQRGDLFLCVFLRRSFELQEPQEADRNPAGLVRVVRDNATARPAGIRKRSSRTGSDPQVFMFPQVRLEETSGAVENPNIADIQRDEGELLSMMSIWEKISLFLHLSPFLLCAP